MSLQFFKNRATVRSYSDREISDAQLEEMLHLASQAPNTGNMQWYSVIVSRNDEIKKLLAPEHFNQPQVESAAAVLTFCVDLNRFEKWCRLNGAEPGYENFQSFIAAFIDTCLFAQQFCTIAEMSGIGTCYLGTTTYNAPRIAGILSLPDRVVPVTTVTLGYPAGGVFPDPSFRLSPRAVIHKEKYVEPSEDNIREWYAPLEKESQHFVEENNKQSLAQVFTDIRYAREANEYFSKVYLDFIRQNRFI